MFDATVGGQFLKTLPGHPLAQALPPRISQPEERGAIGMLEMPFVPGHSEKAMFEQRIIARVGGDVQRLRCPVQHPVCRVRTFDLECVIPLYRRCEANRPLVAPGPKRGNQPFLAAIAEDDIDLQVQERVSIFLIGRERGFKNGPLFRTNGGRGLQYAGRSRENQEQSEEE